MISLYLDFIKNNSIRRGNHIGNKIGDILRGNIFTGRFSVNRGGHAPRYATGGDKGRANARVLEFQLQRSDKCPQCRLGGSISGGVSRATFAPARADGDQMSCFSLEHLLQSGLKRCEYACQVRINRVLPVACGYAACRLHFKPPRTSDDDMQRVGIECFV